jgi:hypothetical protein
VSFPVVRFAQLGSIQTADKNAEVLYEATEVLTKSDVSSVLQLWVYCGLMHVAGT